MSGPAPYPYSFAYACCNNTKDESTSLILSSSFKAGYNVATYKKIHPETFDSEERQSTIKEIETNILLKTTPERIRTEGREHVEQIRKLQAFLRGVVAEYGTALQKSWRKKKREGRSIILRKAWPNMPPSHAADMDAWLTMSKEAVVMVPPSRRFHSSMLLDWCKFPYINEEDLIKADNLLLLLSLRASNPPEHFALADFRAACNGYVLGLLDMPPFLDEYTMVMIPSETEYSYGHLCSWEEAPEALEWLRSGVGMLPGDGLHVLGYQERVLAFLAECCRLILPGKDLSKIKFAGTSDVQLGRSLSMTETEVDLQRLATIASEEAYRTPVHVDFKSLASLVESRLSAVEDHMFALRESPRYFAQCMEEYRQHQAETVKDHDGNIHHLAANPGKRAQFLNKIISHIVFDDYLRLLSFKELRRQLAELIMLEAKYSNDGISIEKPLPDDYASAIFTLVYDLSQLVELLIDEFIEMTTMAPALRDIAVRDLPRVRDQHKCKVWLLLSKKKSPDQRFFLWLEDKLDPSRRWQISVTSIVDKLVHLLQMNDISQHVSSPLAREFLCDVAVMALCIRRFESHPQLAPMYASLNAERKKALAESWEQRTQWWKLVTNKRLFRFGKFGNLGNFVEPEMFTYPEGQRKTKDTVEKMRLAEKNLDTVWLMFDKAMEDLAKTSGDNGVKLRQTLSRQLSRPVKRTPEWVEPIAVAQAAPKKVTEQPSAQELREQQLELERRTEATIDRSAPTAPAKKEKKKKNKKTKRRAPQPGDTIGAPAETPK